MFGFGGEKDNSAVKVIKEKDPTEQMLLDGVKISDLTNEQLISLKNNRNIPMGVYYYVIEEYLWRLRRKATNERQYGIKESNIAPKPHKES